MQTSPVAGRTPTVGATGDIGAGILAGTGHTIEWRCDQQFPGEAFTSANLYLVATDAAGVVSIASADFEADAQPNATLTLTAPTGWSAYGPVNGATRVVGTLNPNLSGHFLDRPPSVANVGLVFLQDAAQAEGGLQQAVGAVLEANAYYRLECLVGNIDEGTANFGYFDLTGFPGYRVELLAGGTAFATDNNTLAGAIPEGEFRTSVAERYVPGAFPNLGQPISIRLVNLDQPGTVEDPGIEVNFDEVTLVCSGWAASGTMTLDAISPTAGVASAAPTSQTAPIPINYVGASDAHSGLAAVELWYRFESGAWTYSGTSGIGGTGFLFFTPPGTSPANFGEYFFDLVAIDNAGNRSAAPTGSTGAGDTSTIFGPAAGIPTWDVFDGFR